MHFRECVHAVLLHRQRLTLQQVDEADSSPFHDGSDGMIPGQKDPPAEHLQGGRSQRSNMAGDHPQGPGVAQVDQLWGIEP